MNRTICWWWRSTCTVVYDIIWYRSDIAPKRCLFVCHCPGVGLWRRCFFGNIARNSHTFRGGILRIRHPIRRFAGRGVARCAVPQRVRYRPYSYAMPSTVLSIQSTSHSVFDIDRIAIARLHDMAQNALDGYTIEVGRVWVSYGA